MSKAFTVIEMLVVLVILSILVLTTVAKPVGNFYFDVISVKNSLLYAYNKAFASNSNVRLYYYEQSNKLVFKAGSKTITQCTLRYSKITNYPYFKNMEFKANGTVTPTGKIVLQDLAIKTHLLSLSIGIFGSITTKEYSK